MSIYWLVLVINLWTPSIYAKITGSHSDSSAKLAQIGRGLYDLNEYLENRCSSENETDDISASFRLTRDLLANEAAETKTVELVEAANMFISLEHLNTKQSCDSTGYNIISDFNIASKGLAKYRQRKVDRVAFTKIVEHAKLCLGEYVSKFEKISDHMDLSKKEDAETFLETLMDFSFSHLYYQTIIPSANSINEVLDISPINFIRLMGDVKRDTKSEAIVMREAALTRMTDSSGSSVRISSDTKKENAGFEFMDKILEAHILEPCKYYDQTIGLNVFDPFIQDYETLMDDRQSWPSVRDFHGSRQFHMGLATVKVCRMYVLHANRQELVQSMI